MSHHILPHQSSFIHVIIRRFKIIFSVRIELLTVALLKIPAFQDVSAPAAPDVLDPLSQFETCEDICPATHCLIAKDLNRPVLMCFINVERRY
jgi:hypothetical protein